MLTAYATIPPERRGEMKTAASAKPESSHKPAGDKPRFSAKMTAFASTGIACPLAWGFLINAFGGVSPSAQLPWTFSYLLLAVAVLLFAAVSRKAPRFFTSGISAAVVGALGAVGALLLALTLTAIPSIPLQFAAMALCACVLGWLYLQWGTFYAKLDLRHAVIYLLLANIGGSALKALTHFVPAEVQCVFAMLLPIASVWMCRVALSGVENASAEKAVIRFDSHNMQGLWKVAVTIAAFSFVTAFLVSRFSGNQSQVPAVDFLLGRLLEMVISGIVLFVVVKLNKPFNFSQLWRIALLVLALDMLSQATFPEMTVLRCVESSAWDLIVLFAWLTLSDVAQHSKLPAPWVFGIGWACYTAPFAIGSMMPPAYSGGEYDAVIVVALMFVLLLVSSFCLEMRDQDTKWLFAELRGEPVSAPADYRSLEERCEEVGKQHKLTPRELEIMQLLCKGRTKAYIAETLYLTENTVKGHTKHIYSKLDVHSKQELLDLVER